MPSQIDEIVRRRVIEQWINGFPRDKIASDLQIGAGTVSEFKIGLENSEFDSIRQLALEIRKRQLNWSDLASHFRLYNYFKGASEEKVESFITNVSSNDVPPEKVIELVNQLHDISKEESISLGQIPDNIKQKLEEKRKIDEEIKEADAILQSKNVSIDAINEHIKLNEEFNKHGQSTHNIPRLLGLLKQSKTNNPRTGPDKSRIL